MPKISEKQKKMMADVGYITAAEAVKMAGMSKETLYRWARTGFIKSETIGRTVYFNRSSLKAVLGPLSR